MPVRMYCLPVSPQVVVPPRFVLAARKAAGNSLPAWGAQRPSIILVFGPHMPVKLLRFRKALSTVAAGLRLRVVFVMLPGDRKDVSNQQSSVRTCASATKWKEPQTLDHMGVGRCLYFGKFRVLDRQIDK